MNLSTLKNNTKREKGRPRTEAVPLTVRIYPKTIKNLDAFIATQSDKPSRPEAIRRILDDWLTAHPEK